MPELPNTAWPLGEPPRLGTPLPGTMSALAIRRDDYGPPRDSVRLETVPSPRLRPDQATRVLVAVLATGPNYNTNFAALGLPVPVFGRGDPARLHVPGSDAVGIVVDAGPGVTALRVGQAVILDSWTGRTIRGYETHDGFNAQFAVVDASRAIPLPDALRDFSPERLAPVLLTYGTAYRAVVERLAVRPGDSVLVMGGGKGTSFPGAQIAKRLGARVILMGSNPALARSLIRRGHADAFVDRRRIPGKIFGPLPPGAESRAWSRLTAPFRRAVLAANRGRPVDKVFEHTGGANFPLLVSVIAPGGALAFFGATGSGLKGEYKETFFHDGRRFVMDARWVWMRQKQVLFRNAPPGAILDEIRLPPGRRGMVWGADAPSRAFVRAAGERGADVAVVASFSREKAGIAALLGMGVPRSRLIDRDRFVLPEDMPDPLTEDGRPNPDYNASFLRNAQALGKALWDVFGPRTSPDFVVDRTDQSTLHFSTFVVRDFDEREAVPCGHVVARSRSDLSILGSHMYASVQASEVVRLLSTGHLAMEAEDVEVVSLPGLPLVQQKMLDGTMAKPKGAALVQADRPGRPVREYEEAYLGETVRAADPPRGRFVEVRRAGAVGIVAIRRPEALNALNALLLEQLAEVVREAATRGTVGGRDVRALVLTGTGRAFVAGADVTEFLGREAGAIADIASRTIALFSEIENLPLPVVALVDGFALGGGNELAMSAHYRIATENALFGQPEVKLGILPGYGGLQRLPRLVGPVRAAELCVNGEPVDGYEAASIGLADAFCPAAAALKRAVERAAAFADGTVPVPRRDWDALAAARSEELRTLWSRPGVRDLLAAPPPGLAEAKDLRAARSAAAREILLAMEHGFENGIAAGLRNDARSFGHVAASPGGQEWIRRFIEKDPLQQSFLTLLPPAVPGGKDQAG